MFKLLVITTYYTHAGCSVHSLVISFDSEDQANTAFHKIKTSSIGQYHRTLEKLY